MHTVMNTGWYDDEPVYKSPNEKVIAMLAQLNPIDEWLTQEELDELIIDLYPMAFILPITI